MPLTPLSPPPPSEAEDSSAETVSTPVVPVAKECLCRINALASGVISDTILRINALRPLEVDEEGRVDNDEFEEEEEEEEEGILSTPFEK
jgi:hypothetical protein